MPQTEFLNGHLMIISDFLCKQEVIMVIIILSFDQMTLVLMLISYVKV